MTRAHTWKIEYGDPGISEDTRIVDLFTGETVGFVRERYARLVAAAPALLEALERIVNMCGDTKPGREARAAIAQARGEKHA